MTIGQEYFDFQKKFFLMLQRNFNSENLLVGDATDLGDGKIRFDAESTLPKPKSSDKYCLQNGQKIYESNFCFAEGEIFLKQITQTCSCKCKFFFKGERCTLFDFPLYARSLNGYDFENLKFLKNDDDSLSGTGHGRLAGNGHSQTKLSHHLDDEEGVTFIREIYVLKFFVAALFSFCLVLLVTTFYYFKKATSIPRHAHAGQALKGEAEVQNVNDWQRYLPRASTYYGTGLPNQKTANDNENENIKLTAFSLSKNTNTIDGNSEEGLALSFPQTTLTFQEERKQRSVSIVAIPRSRRSTSVSTRNIKSSKESRSFKNAQIQSQVLGPSNSLRLGAPSGSHPRGVARTINEFRKPVVRVKRARTVSEGS